MFVMCYYFSFINSLSLSLSFLDNQNLCLSFFLSLYHLTLSFSRAIALNEWNKSYETPLLIYNCIKLATHFVFNLTFSYDKSKMPIQSFQFILMLASFLPSILFSNISTSSGPATVFDSELVVVEALYENYRDWFIPTTHSTQTNICGHLIIYSH